MPYPTSNGMPNGEWWLRNKTEALIMSRIVSYERIRNIMEHQKRFGFVAPTTDADIVELFNPSRPELTRAEICRALGRSKSPRVRQMLAALVEDGRLTYRFIRLPNHVDMYVYSRTEIGDLWLNGASLEDARRLATEAAEFAVESALS